jgi:hypothetical protein
MHPERSVDTEPLNGFQWFIVICAACGLLVSVMFLSYLGGSTESGIESAPITRDTTQEAIKDERIDRRKSIQSRVQKLQPKLDPTVAAIISRCIENSCQIYDLEPEMVMAVCFRESSFNPMAESSARCLGLMQVNFDVWKDELGLGTYYRTFHISVNIDAGCRILKIYRDKHDGNWQQALDDYSGGKSNYYNGVMKLANELTLTR